MPKDALVVSSLQERLFLGWGIGVDKSGKSLAQTLKLIASSTSRLLDISHSTTLIRNLISAFPQHMSFFTHGKNPIFKGWFVSFYPFSPTHIKEASLIKDLYI